MAMELITHPESWVSEENLTILIPPYQKTYAYVGDYIDEFHRSLFIDFASGMLEAKIKGSLRRADALKLYELAYFSGSAVLEMGTYHGLSAWIIANAIKNAGARREFISVDLHEELSAVARKNLEQAGVSGFARFVSAEGTAALNCFAAAGKRFGFAFIDHSHTYEHVWEACVRLPHVLEPDALVLFHDFNDRRNVDPGFSDYGVLPAVVDAQELAGLKFLGVYGCAGLYQFTPLR